MGEILAGAGVAVRPWRAARKEHSWTPPPSP
jgi:hypothetical protein